MPLSTFDVDARSVYRAALAGHVVEVLYHAWQRDRSLPLAEIVHGVRASDATAPLVEIHRAIGHLECSGLIDYDHSGRWRRNTDTGPGSFPVMVCGRQGCTRPAEHDGDHLPDLGIEPLLPELVVHHSDFLAAWSCGAEHRGWVRMYATEHDWLADNPPLAWLRVPQDCDPTAATLVDLLSGWLAEGRPAAEREDHD